MKTHNLRTLFAVAQPLPLSADSVPAAHISSTAPRFTCRAAHAFRSAPLPGSISSSRQHQAVSSRHAAALEALKLLLRNKAVNQNGNALKGAARRLERAWAGCGSDSIIPFNCLKWSSFLLQATVPRQQNIERSKKKSGETPQIDLAVFTPLLATHAAIIDALVRSFSLHPHVDGRKNRLILQSVKLARKFMLIGKHGFMPNLVLSTILNNEKLVDGSDSTAIRYALVLGEAVGCLVYKKWDLAHVASLKDKVGKYFEKNLIAGSAKSAVPKTVLSSFDLFFKQFLTAEMLQNQLCASAERLMLRSPEFILRIFESIIKPVAFDVFAKFLSIPF
ncbi:hypothetical protein BJ741DRAFT_695568 [Chytriomyces cf. hyalinus JEL632]|nr:hypothetical protein BJ741DRAFT_695568 [Chytriomyces cf. hyalinus JEL632]